MTDTLSIEDLKKLNVVDLRQELEKRGLEKSGMKSDLLKRLEKSLEERGAKEEKDDEEDRSSTGEAKEEIKVNGDGCTDEAEKIEDEDTDSVEDHVEADSLDSEMKSPDSGTPMEKNIVEPAPSDEQPSFSSDHLESDPLHEQADSTSCTAEENMEPCEFTNPKLPDASAESTESKNPELPDAFVESTECPSAEIEMPKSDMTKEQADSTTSDQQDNDGQEEKTADSTSSGMCSENSLCDGAQSDVNDEGGSEDTNKLPVDKDDQVASEDVNELPEDERVDSNTYTIIDDDMQDEELAEEDQTISISISDEHQNEFDESNEGEKIETEKNSSFITCKDNDSLELHEKTGKSPEKASKGKGEGSKSINDDKDASKRKDVDDDNEVVEIPALKASNIVVIDDDDKEQVAVDKNEATAVEPSVTEKSAKDKTPAKTKSSKPSSFSRKDTAESSEGSGVQDKDTKLSDSDSRKKQSKRDSEHKDTKDKKKKDLSSSLWITGLSSVTKAVDLKELFTKHGKVVCAKVVTSAKTPGSQCFGFVTMSSVSESLDCIKTLNKTVLHNKTIEVDKAKTDPTPKKPPLKPRSGDRREEEKSRSSRHTSKSSLSRSSRDHSRRAQDERKSDNDRKHSEKGREKKTTGSKTAPKVGSAKALSFKESPNDARATKPIEVKSRSVSKEGDNGDDLVVIENQNDEKTSKEDGKENDNEKEDEKTKSKKEMEKKRKEREERRKKEREREEKLREERRREREKREKERKERARKEAERVRKEREKQRELEREREHQREKERENYLRERREREERERKEREQLDRERLERERLERERRERERLENERMERERQERERQDKERQAREEKEQLERERIERERRAVLVDRGLGIKRPIIREDERREYHPDQKRSLRDVSQNARKNFFSPSGNRTDLAPSQHRNELAYDHRRDSNSYRPDNRATKGDACEPIPRDKHDSRSNTRPHESGKDRLGYNQPSSDIRRVIPRDTKGDSYNRDRSPHRANNPGSKHHDSSSKSQNISNAPKTLSDVLGRAGLSGILGSRAEEKPSSWADSTGRSGDRFYSSGNHSNQNSNRGIERSHIGPNAVDYREQRYTDTRVDSRNRQDTLSDDHRRGQRTDECRGETTHFDDPYRRSGERLGDRVTDYRGGNACDDHRESRMEARAGPNSGTVHSNSVTNERNFNGDNRHNNQLPLADRRELYQSLTTDINNVVPGITPPRILPLANMFSRPLQVVPPSNTQAIQAGYMAAAQGLALQNVGRTGIQLNRNGRLEYTRMPTPQTGVSLNRRF